MKSFLRRTGNGGPATALNRELKRMIRRRARVLAIGVVLSLLAASLPASSANTLVRQASNGQAQNISMPAQLYRSVSQSVASIGAWMANIFSSTPPTSDAYQPVTAYISPAPPFIDAPTNLNVTAASASSISLSWTAPAGSVDHYQVERATNVEGPFFVLTNVSGATTTHSDNTVTNLQSYLYRVRAVTAFGLPSGPSNMALGTAISFQFNELDGQLIKAQHLHDVRTAINLVRTVGNLTAATWARSNLLGLIVLASDVNELRTKLDEALTALSIPVTAYQDPTLQTGANGTVIHSTHVEQLQARSTKGSSTSFGPIDSDSSTARLDPLSATGGGGENPLSRNFNWNLPLVSLRGRAGLDLSLGLSYNSLVWTKSGTNTLSFNDDGGFPGAGFRLGFPVIQHLYFNSEVGKLAFLLINPDGSRTELRQVGATDLYAAADSSHLLLDAATMVLRAYDGTQMTYVMMGNEFNCTQVKDRNGNYLTINYTPAGRIDTVVDTLARSIKFNYDANGWLTSITQVWNQGQPSQVTHNWARFEYANVAIDYNFGSMNVFGLADNSTLKVLSRVKLADDSYFDFSYTNWGQVWKITHFAADNSVVNYRSYNLPQTTAQHSDCPRFTNRKDWAKYWNGDTDGTVASNEEATTTFMVPTSDTWTMPDSSQQTGMRAEVTTPDGQLDKIYYIGVAGTSSGWQRGLQALVETHSGGTWQRKTMTTWTQDNTSVSYPLNPRVTNTNIYDPAGNRARTEITYQQFTFANGTSCHLPIDLYEYAPNATTKLRSTRVDYNTSTTYTSRRLIGLVSERRLYEGDVNSGGTLKARLAYFFDNDNGASSIQGTDAPIQHDNTNYTASFVAGRANVSSVRRYNVDNQAQFTTSFNKFNTAGALVSGKDASNHEVTVSYSDSFSDGNNSRNTLAYPTSVNDGDLYTSTKKYNFDFGVVTASRTPQPNGTSNTLGPQQFFAYDVIGRLQQVSNSVTSLYTRIEYSTNQIRGDSFTTFQDGLGEARSFKITDGHGRMIASVTEHPGSTGGYRAQRMVYDVMGQRIKTSNPAETAASGAPAQWTTVGDDASVGWIFTEQTYDWKGRRLVTTYPSMTSNPAETTTRQFSYSGCGCAGGDVITETDEGTLDEGVPKRRQQKIYRDVLGRKVKTEMLNWEGGSVYSATVNTYDARDLITQTREYAGAEGSGTFQDTTMTYDGYGRLKTRHRPEQDVATVTSWDYNDDDTVQKVTDARNATATMTYNNRHLVTEIAYAAPSPIPDTPNTSFTYDAAGNRLSMNDASGSTTFQYSALSQITSETRTFTGLAGSFGLSYEYALGGNLKSLTDPTNKKVNYGYDKTGRLSTVTGTNYSVTDFVDSIDYRAWNAPQQVVYGNGRSLNYTFNNRLAITNLEMPAAGGFATEIDKDYEYYNDRRVKYSRDNVDGRYDRSFQFDHARRLVKAKSGAEARGEPATNDRPYNQSSTYDAFNHLNNRTSRHWSRIFPYISNDTYSNNRRIGWQYDADGNLIDDVKRTFTYDAAARVIASSGGDVGQVFDGEGRRAKSTESGFATYYLISNVTGNIIAHLDPTGSKALGFVYALDGLLAEEFQNGFVGFVHRDASALSLRKTHSTAGNTFEAVELDPQGADVELEDPYLSEPEYDGREEGGPFYPGFGNFTDPGNCTVDGVYMPCSMATRMLESGAAVMVPADGLTRYNHETKQFEFFRAHSDGYSGYLPADALYLGNGYAISASRNPGSDNELAGVIKLDPTPEIHLVNDAQVNQIVIDCANSLYSMFKVTKFTQTTQPKSSADDHTKNGVAAVEDTQGRGYKFNLVNDPTPTADATAIMKNTGSLGLTVLHDPAGQMNPYWSFTCLTCGNLNNAPGGQRYPQLYGNRPLLMVQVHELGAQLSEIRDKKLPGPYAPLKDNGLFPGGHGDEGPALEDCVGRRYFEQNNLKSKY